MSDSLPLINIISCVQFSLRVCVREMMMDAKGGCCIARYAGGAYDMSKVDRIMLRFRPIAPKPTSAGSVSGGSTLKSDEVYLRTGRGKRRYVRDNSKRCNRKRKASPEEKRDEIVGEAVVTLPLLPETPDRKDWSPPGQSDLLSATKPQKNPPIWLSFANGSTEGHCGSDRAVITDRTVVMPQPVRLVGSCVTVECVTDTWVDGDWLGSTDEEKINNLDRDTCPGFVSDGLNRVTWTNAAYRRMVGHVTPGPEMMVWLVMKARVPVTFPAITCRVRLQYRCGKEKNSLTLPCDVWRMDGGGFAWRLDVKAALSVGR